MTKELKGKHFLSCDDWTKEELDVVFNKSFELKEQFKNEVPHLHLPYKTLFMIFFEQSTRTSDTARRSCSRFDIR